MRISHCNFLGNCGDEPAEVAGITEGMHKAGQIKRALIILDGTMPKEGGIQMYREFKKAFDYEAGRSIKENPPMSVFREEEVRVVAGINE